MSLAGNLDAPENWYGGFYELAICLGPPDDGRLNAALMAVWRCACVQGCYRRAAERHLPVECSLRTLEQHGHLAGIVRLPDGGEVVCGVTVVREPEGDDWLDFYLPLGALGKHDPGSAPFPSGTTAVRFRRLGESRSNLGLRTLERRRSAKFRSATRSSDSKPQARPWMK